MEVLCFCYESLVVAFAMENSPRFDLGNVVFLEFLQCLNLLMLYEPKCLGCVLLVVFAMMSTAE